MNEPNHRDGSTRKAVFVRMGSRPIPRVLRMMRVAREMGCTPIFCGAHRERDLPDRDSWDGYEVLRTGPFCPPLHGRRPIAFAKLICGFNLAAYRCLRHLQPELIHVSDIEALPGAVLYARSRGVPLIYNIHDNVAQRYRVPRWVQAVLNQIEGVGVRMADRTLVPEPYRRDALPRSVRDGVTVVRNTPRDPGAEFGLENVTAGPTQTIRLFYGGWIDRGRGFETLFEMLDRDADLTMRVAGEGDPEIIRSLEGHPQIDYLGFIDHDRIMTETAACDFVPALYDPSRPINRFAASNKLAEAFAMGRPVLANSELEIVRYLGSMRCIVDAAYGDAGSLHTRMRSLRTDTEAYRAARAQARSVYEDQYAWEEAEARMRSLLGQLLGDHEAGERGNGPSAIDAR